MVKAYVWACFISASIFSGASAAVLNISYTNGKQTGNFKMDGVVHDATPSKYPDTVIIDSAFQITTFIASKPFDTLCRPLPMWQYGFNLQIQNGSEGKLASADTVWTSATTFPNSLLPLDTVPLTSFVDSPASSLKGLNIGVVFGSGECSTGRDSLVPGHSNVIYFKFTQGLKQRYGKIMMYGYKFLQGSMVLVSDSTNYTAVAYTLSDTTDINTGPVPIYFHGSSDLKGRNFSGLGNRFFLPNGQRVQKESLPNRTFLSIPLLAPRP